MQHLASSLRVLIVAPRPTSLKPFPDRAEIEGLYDALEAQGEQVEAEWLWPPTWEALVGQLKSGETPPAIVCLDTVVRQKEGTPAFLFETAEARAQAVDPMPLAEHLKSRGVSLLILYPREADQVDIQALAAQMIAGGSPHIMVLDGSLSPEKIEGALRAFFAACLATSAA